MRLAIVAASTYDQNGQVEPIPNAELDVELFGGRLAEADAGFVVHAFPAQRGLADGIEELVSTVGVRPTALIFYFWGYALVSQERGPTLLLDGPKLGSFTLARLRKQLAELADVALVVLDTTLAEGSHGTPFEAVRTMGSALSNADSSVSSLIAVRASGQRVAQGPPPFTGLLQMILDAQTGSPSALTPDALFRAMQAEDVLFADIPAAGCFLGRREFVLVPGVTSLSIPPAAGSYDETDEVTARRARASRAARRVAPSYPPPPPPPLSRAGQPASFPPPAPLPNVRPVSFTPPPVPGARPVSLSPPPIPGARPASVPPPARAPRYSSAPPPPVASVRSASVPPPARVARPSSAPPAASSAAEHLRHLLREAERAGDRDGAYRAAACLEAIGEADINESLLATTHRPDGLQAVRSTLSYADWHERLCVGCDEPRTSAVLRTLGPALSRVGFQYARRMHRQPMLPEEARQDPEKSTTTLAKTLYWSSRLLCVSASDLYVLPEMPNILSLEPGPERPLLTCARTLGSGFSLPELVCLWSRELSFARHEQAALCYFPSAGELSQLVLAALAVSGVTSMRRIDGEAKRLASLLKREVRGAALEALQSVAQAFPVSEVLVRASAFIRCAELVSARVALVACGDLELTLALDARFPRRGLVQPEARRADLLRFAVSSELGEIRAALGVAVA